MICLLWTQSFVITVLEVPSAAVFRRVLQKTTSGHQGAEDGSFVPVPDLYWFWILAHHYVDSSCTVSFPMLMATFKNPRADTSCGSWKHLWEKLHANSPSLSCFWWKLERLTDIQAAMIFILVIISDQFKSFGFTLETAQVWLRINLYPPGWVQRVVERSLWGCQWWSSSPIWNDWSGKVGCNEAGSCIEDQGTDGRYPERVLFPAKTNAFLQDQTDPLMNSLVSSNQNQQHNQDDKQCHWRLQNLFWHPPAY